MIKLCSNTIYHTMHIVHGVVHAEQVLYMESSYRIKTRPFFYQDYTLWYLSLEFK